MNSEPPLLRQQMNPLVLAIVSVIISPQAGTDLLPGALVGGLSILQLDTGHLCSQKPRLVLSAEPVPPSGLPQTLTGCT